MTKDEALALALNALHTKGEHHPRVYEAIAAIQTVLAQPVQEQRQWVGLTGEEIDELAEWHGLDLMVYVPFTEAIEAKLKEKNNGN
jgi:hypothetical protein